MIYLLKMVVPQAASSWLVSAGGGGIAGTPDGLLMVGSILVFLGVVMAINSDKWTYSSFNYSWLYIYHYKPITLLVGP